MSDYFRALCIKMLSGLHITAKICKYFVKANEKVVTKFDPANIQNSQSEKLFGVTIERYLSFEKHK